MRYAPIGALLLAACAAGPQGPAELDSKNDTCASCRMPVSDVHTAAQLVAPSEVPLFFDDLGCLRDYLKGHPPARGTAAFVADHATAAWVPAPSAVYSRVPSLQTPMASHLIAHANPASRELDAAARGGEAVAAAELLGAELAEARR